MFSQHNNAQFRICKKSVKLFIWYVENSTSPPFFLKKVVEWHHEMVPRIDCRRTFTKDMWYQWKTAIVVLCDVNTLMSGVIFLKAELPNSLWREQARGPNTKEEEVMTTLSCKSQI
jgi:hypothetical protein